MAETLQRNGLWHIVLVEQDLINQSGFNQKDFEQDFRDKILSKYENHIPVELVFQALDNLPAGFQCPEGRVKP